MVPFSTQNLLLELKQIMYKHCAETIGMHIGDLYYLFIWIRTLLLNLVALAIKCNCKFVCYLLTSENIACMDFICVLLKGRT